MFDNITKDLREFIENLLSKITNKFESLTELMNDNYIEIRQKLKTIRHHYVIKPVDKTVKLPNEFDGKLYGSDDCSLSNFYSGADLKVGDVIYGFDDYYYQMNVEVVRKVYSVNNNTTYLFVKNVPVEDYIYSDEFKSFVISLVADINFIQNCMDKYKEENDIDVMPDEFIGTIAYYRYIAGRISEEVELYSAIDYQNRVYVIMKILSEEFKFDWHRPNKFEFSND